LGFEDAFVEEKELEVGSEFAKERESEGGFLCKQTVKKTESNIVRTRLERTNIMSVH